MNYKTHNNIGLRGVLSLLNTKILLFLSLLLVLVLQNSSQAIWLSKDQFMQQYSTKLVNGFPDEPSRRAVVQHWCEAITNSSLPSNIVGTSKKDTIQGFVYMSGTYTSPNQSALAHLICSPFLDSARVKDRFDKKLINSIKTTQRDKITPNLDTKTCPITTAGNNLNDCDLMTAVNNIALVVLNDLTNVRHGTSWGHITTNTGVIGHKFATYFTLASGNTIQEIDDNANTSLCYSDSAPPYFGTGGSPIHCGFPTTHALILSNADIGKAILNKTVVINGSKLLQYDCDLSSTGTNLVGCGINDHSNTQSFNNMIYNELWFYHQFMTMYENVSSLDTNFLVGNKTGLGRQGQDQLLNQIKIKRQHQSRLITNATQVSINLISQMESAYPLHIGLEAVEESTQTAVSKYIKPRQNSIKNRMIDRLKTQKKATISKGT